MAQTQRDASKQQKWETLKVLIADDDPPTLVLLRAAISQWGYQVVEAHDGEEVWTILQTEDAPRLLILDWLMPRLDGIELSARIKQNLGFRPYIILLTQMSGTSNIVKGLEAGTDEFLSKPFNMAELKSRLSVGARIIQCDIDLREQFSHLETLSKLATDISNKTDALLQSNLSNDASQKAMLQDLQKIR